MIRKFINTTLTIACTVGIVNVTPIHPGFLRRNLMLLIVLISFTGCGTYINEDEAIIVSAHKTTHSKTYRYYYQLNSANGKYIFYSNQEFQVGTPIKLCPR